MMLVSDVNQVAGRMQQTLRHEKTCREFAIFAGRPHHDGDSMAFNPDFQRFLGGQKIPVLTQGGAFHPLHRNFSDRPGKQR
jgi:hypothetical protein